MQVDTPVSHIDLLPTMMALAGIEQPQILPGENILNIEKPRGVMVEFNRYEIEHDSFGGFIPVRCWVTDDWKLVLNLFTSDELYDRRNDPDELHNLIDSPQLADVRCQMHDALLDYMDKIRDPFRTYQWSLRPWRPDAVPRWMGAFRPRPQDGYSPVVRDYDTGLPTRGVKWRRKSRSSEGTPCRIGFSRRHPAGWSNWRSTAEKGKYQHEQNDAADNGNAKSRA